MLHGIQLSHTKFEVFFDLRAVVRDSSMRESTGGRLQKLHSHQSVHHSIGKVQRGREGERCYQAIRNVRRVRLDIIEGGSQSL